jgi:thiamine-monophosphate kinase
MGWSEDRLHRWLLRGAAPRGLTGSRGHDAAVLGQPRGRVVTCVDQCIEGVHFLPDAAPRAIGHKSAGRALSDLAATAAAPRAIVLALCAPRTKSDAWMKALISGARAHAVRFGADLVGGDLSARAGPVHVSVTALGEVSAAGRPVGRDRARAGQALVVTGALGGSLAGRHLKIRPRIELGARLARAGATAMMDVSDGLAYDLYRLARASGVAIELELERVPIHRDARRMAQVDGRSALAHALDDGEDHELVATLAPAALAHIQRTDPRRARELVAIGRVRRGGGLWLVHADGRRVRWDPRSGGFRHAE